MARPLDFRVSAIPKADDLYGKLTIAAAVFFVVLEIAYFVMAPAHSLGRPAVDAFHVAIGRDFINTWMGGRAALTGSPAAWFDFETYNAALRAVTADPDLADYFWSYPPHLLLFTWPLALMPYLPAYALWCVVGLGLYLLAARAAGIERRHLPFLAVAPGAAVNVFFGQNGFFTAALLIGGLANLDRRPVLSGVLFGILTVKPQFGLLLPVMLVLTGRWRVIGAAAVTIAVLVAAASSWFGTDVWLDYIRKVGPQQHWLLTQGGGLLLPMVSSAFVGARLAGLPLAAAWIVQALCSGCALLMVVWTFWRPREPALSFAVLVTATFLFSPWMLNYDMVVFGWTVALLRERDDGAVLDRRLGIAMWALPVAMMLFGAAHIPIALVVLPAFAGRLIWRLRRSQTEAAHCGPAAPLAAVVDLPAH